MVSILPSERSPLDVLGRELGRSLSSVVPQGFQQGYQRQLGMNALQQAEQDIAQAGGDPFKIALAFAKAGSQAPGLERALAPLMQTAMNAAQAQRAFPSGGKLTTPSGVGAPLSSMGAVQGPTFAQPQEPGITPKEPIRQAEPSTFATPSPFNLMTPQDINAEAERFAVSTQNPGNYAVRQQQLQNQNTIANEQRSGLEDMLLKGGITPAELPRVMEVGSKFDIRNPTEWAQNTLRKYNQVKSNDKKLQNAFIPGIGSGLLGKDREKSLKNLEKVVQDQVNLGQEQETRNFLADNYLTPTEIETLIHPIRPEQEKAISRLPRGLFPPETKKTTAITYEKGFPSRQTQREISPFVSYEEALEKAPKELAQMEETLSDFFLNNVDKETSLLPLRQKIWETKDYDWRQFGPAIRRAEKKGLKLTPAQSTEMAQIETQAPYESLPELFQDFDRVWKFIRGNK